MDAEKLALQVSPIVFDRSDPSLIRDRPGQDDNRADDFDENYDFDTLFYDIFHDEDADQIVLIGPSLLNLRAILDDAVFTLDGVPVQLAEVTDISRGVVATLPAHGRKPQILGFQHRLFSTEVPIGARHLDLFEGRNVLYGISRNNQLSWVRDWVRYYATEHGADAVVIMDNRSTEYDCPTLMNALAQVSGPQVLCVGNADFPFGSRGQSNTDYQSLFLQRTLIELVRRRLLAKARAVVIVDIDELFHSYSGQSIFDKAVNSPDGYVRGNAFWVYADPTDMADVPRFADHTLVSASGTPKSNRKYCAVPQGPQQHKQWLSHFINGRGDPVDPDLIMWHFHQISTGWKYDRSQPPRRELVPSPPLIDAMARAFGMPDEEPPSAPAVIGRDGSATRRSGTLAITSMKNEGPYILEWIAYHRAVGIDRFLVYTNDCEDGTAEILDRLEELGVLVHERNKVLRRGPQKSALKYARDHELTKMSDWIVVFDIDEFLNIHLGGGRISDLMSAVPEAGVIPVTWKLFSNHGRVNMPPGLVIDSYFDAEPDLAHGGQRRRFVKSLFRNDDRIKRFGTHGPIFHPEVNIADIWRAPDGGMVDQKSPTRPRHRFAYEAAQINHYATRAVDAFLLKKARGRVNHFRQEMGLDYWIKMNRGGVIDTSIQRWSGPTRTGVAEFRKDRRLAALIDEAQAWFSESLVELRRDPEFEALRNELIALTNTGG